MSNEFGCCGIGAVRTDVKEESYSSDSCRSECQHLDIGYEVVVPDLDNLSSRQQRLRWEITKCFQLQLYSLSTTTYSSHLWLARLCLLISYFRTFHSELSVIWGRNIVDSSIHEGST
jgi:hypothetical protein